MKCVLIMPLTDIQPRAISAQGVGEQRFTEAAVLLGNHQPEDSHLLHTVDDGLWIFVAVLQLGRHGDDLLIDELLDELEQLLLVVGETVGRLES